jgi:hypothetical protein
MKILMVNDSIMLHLTKAEATAVAHMLDINASSDNQGRAYREHGPMLAEIVRQIDICLNART